MTDSTLPTTASSPPLALPSSVATAIAWARGLLHGAGESPGRRDTRQLAGELFPAAIGATDLELVRLGRADDLMDVLRRARTETGVRSGLI